jgi:hypothetical protein
MIKSEYSGLRGQKKGKYIVYDTECKGETYRTFPFTNEEEKEKALDQANEYIKELVNS